MPLKSRRIDNNVAFSNPNIFEDSGHESIVNDITFSATVGTLAQITLLSVYANDIFTKVSEDIKFASDRLVRLRSKFDELQTSVAIVANFSEDEAEHLSRYDIFQELLLRPATMSQAIFRRYNVVNDTPDYSLVAEFFVDPSQRSPSRHHEAPDLIIMKKFSDPNLFFRRWEGQQERRLKAMREERDKTKAERKAQVKVKIATKRMTKVSSDESGPITGENSSFAPSNKSPLSPIAEAFGRISLSPRSQGSPRSPVPFNNSGPVSVIVDPIDSEVFSSRKSLSSPYVPDTDDDGATNMRVSIVNRSPFPGDRQNESDNEIDQEETEKAENAMAMLMENIDADDDSDDDIEVVDEEMDEEIDEGTQEIRKSMPTSDRQILVDEDEKERPSAGGNGVLPTAMRKLASPKRSPKKAQVMFSDGPLVISDEEYERELALAAAEEEAELAANDTIELSEEDAEVQRTIARASMAYGSRTSLIAKRAQQPDDPEIQRSIERSSITYGSRGSLIAKKSSSGDIIVVDENSKNAAIKPETAPIETVENLRRVAFLEQVRSERPLKSASKLANSSGQENSLSRSSVLMDFGRQSSIIFGVRATEMGGRASISGRVSMSGRASMDGRASMLVGSLRGSPPPRLTMIMREIGAGAADGLVGAEDPTGAAIAGVLANRPALPFSAADLVSRIGSKPTLTFSAVDLMKKIESRTAMPTAKTVAKEETRPALSFASELMKKASSRSTKVDASGNAIAVVPASSSKAGQSKLLDQLVFGAAKLKKVAPPNERKKNAPALGGFCKWIYSLILTQIIESLIISLYIIIYSQLCSIRNPCSAEVSSG